MTASQEESMKAITLRAFFNDVSQKGYPATKQQAQKWKELGMPQLETQKADSKMLVLCSSFHDYGSSGLGGY